MAAARLTTDAPRRASRHAGEILPLTSLRGLAAFCVAIFHMNYWFYLHYWQHGPGVVLRTIFRVGYLNVDLFFVLSGFVITRAYLAWFRRPSVGDYASFLSRRVARVWPLHMVALLLVVGAPDCRAPGTLAANALMVHAWGFVGDFSCNYPSWSISGEWFVYVIFPAIAWLVLRTENTRAASLLALSGLGALATMAYLNPAHTLDLTYADDLGLARALCGFVIGSALCRAVARVRPGLRFDVLALLLALAAFILAARGANDFWIACLFGPLVVALALSDGPVKRLLSLAPLVWLGEISYSVYMLHHFIIETIRGYGIDIDTPLRVALTLALVAGISSASYLWIEKPARRLLQAWLAGLASPAELAVRASRKG